MAPERAGVGRLCVCPAPRSLDWSIEARRCIDRRELRLTPVGKPAKGIVQTNKGTENSSCLRSDCDSLTARAHLKSDSTPTPRNVCILRKLTSRLRKQRLLFDHEYPMECGMECGHCGELELGGSHSIQSESRLSCTKRPLAFRGSVPADSEDFYIISELSSRSGGRAAPPGREAARRLARPLRARARRPCSPCAPCATRSGRGGRSHRQIASCSPCRRRQPCARRPRAWRRWPPRGESRSRAA